MRSNEQVGWQVWLMVLGFVASLALAGVFVVRSFHVVRSFRQDEPIRPWMTIPYIARSYRVSPSILYQAVGLPDRPRDRRPLAVIARAQHRPVQGMIADLQRAIVQARSSAPPAPPGAPGSAQ
jgi:hypothetical protein